MAKTIILELTDEEHAKLVKVAERVNRSLNPKGTLPRVTPVGCLLNFIKTANVDDEWEHPAYGAKVKR